MQTKQQHESDKQDLENPMGIQLEAIKPTKRAEILSIIDELEDEYKIESKHARQDDEELVDDQHGNIAHAQQPEQAAAETDEANIPSPVQRTRCRNAATVRASLAILLYITYGTVYLGDILSMLLLFYPDKGGGIMGCDCNEIAAEHECAECWNCVYSVTYTKCEYFEAGKTRLLNIAFPIIFGYCGIGWFLNELTIWIRICMLCDMYNKESAKHEQQRTRESDEFVMANAGNYFHGSITARLDSLDANRLTVHRDDTIRKYEKQWDADTMGLVPCCFEDVDRYHMKVVLMQNMQKDDALNVSQYQIEEHANKASHGDIGARCCEFPCFAFSFSLSMCWLCPFRYFWFLAVCDLKSKYWRRICWFSLFHLILFDAVWVAFCKMTLGMLNKMSTMEINHFYNGLAPFLEDKMYWSAAMASMIGVVWITIGVYTACTKRRHREYQSVDH